MFLNVFLLLLLFCYKHLWCNIANFIPIKRLALTCRGFFCSVSVDAEGCDDHLVNVRICCDPMGMDALLHG